MGVLSLQGAVAEHLHALEQCGVEALPVKRKGEIARLDGLIIPGGESTTIARLMKSLHLEEPVRELYGRGKPLWGTCAGLVILASEVENEPSHLSLIQVKARRNAFGRQKESFECSLPIYVLGEEPFPAVFIRAPYIEDAGEGVEILARYNGKIVAARQNNVIVTAFHPELTSDLRMHQYFISMS